MHDRMTDLGRGHFAASRALAAVSDDLAEAVAVASRWLTRTTLRAADASESAAAALLNAEIEAMVEADREGESLGFAARFVFHGSIFTAALGNGLTGPLTRRAGELAAMDLQAALLSGLRTGEHRVAYCREAQVLDRIGEALDIAGYRVFVRFVRCAAAIAAARNAGSEVERLVMEAEAEAVRIDAAEFFPAARAQAVGDEEKTVLLAMMEEALS